MGQISTELNKVFLKGDKLDEWMTNLEKYRLKTQEAERALAEFEGKIKSYFPKGPYT